MARYQLDNKSTEELILLRPKIITGRWISLLVVVFSLAFSLLFFAVCPGCFFLLIAGAMVWWLSLTRFLGKLDQELKRR